MNYSAPRGTHDLWAEEAARLSELENRARGIFRSFNYAEIKFPTFEDAGLFTRSLGEATDIIEKEMYVFEDKKGRKLALRPEGTASVVRSLIENDLLHKMPLAKFFYGGSMFRYERPQAGRYREFYQLGAEYFGNPEPVADAEIITLNRELFKSFGINDYKIHLNSLGCQECRPGFRKALKDYFLAGDNLSGLCADCNRRIEKNPLRVLDCKLDGHKFEEVPKMEDHLCGHCKEHFIQVQELLRSATCDFIVDHRLVRGLDYYTRTIFEIRSSALGAQDALSAGGRYDNLVKELGGAPTPAVGFALGSERALRAALASGDKLSIAPASCIFVAVADPKFEKEAFAVALSLRINRKTQR